MTRIGIALVLALFIAGCGPQKSWVKPSATSQERDRDWTECNRDTKATPHHAVGTGSSLGPSLMLEKAGLVFRSSDAMSFILEHKEVIRDAVCFQLMDDLIDVLRCDIRIHATLDDEEFSPDVLDEMDG